MQLLSQARAKHIRLLHQKKYREESATFLVEGEKAVVETLKSDWEVTLIAGTEKFQQTYIALIDRAKDRFFRVGEDQLRQLSTLQSNDSSLCIVQVPNAKPKPDPTASLWLAVEEIRDPGNLGTIIRLADWFGLSQLICIENCVEWFNPKVVSSSMGSFLRVQPVFMTREELILQKERVLVAAQMDGKSLYQFTFPAKATLIVGNESKGISSFLLEKSSSICIPRFGQAESLNAAMATGILLNHWRFGLKIK